MKAVNRGTGIQWPKEKNKKQIQVLKISKSGSTCGIRRVAPVTNR